MIDKKAISERFFLCYQQMSRAAVGRVFGVQRTTVTEWATRGSVPWSRVKYLSDSQAISWDWLIEGIEPRKSMKKAKIPVSSNPEFAVNDLNLRFLSLFTDMKYNQIAMILGVTSGPVSEWKLGKSQVPWEKLAYAVHEFNVRWDWLIDGLEPKCRDQWE